MPEGKAQVRALFSMSYFFTAMSWHKITIPGANVAAKSCAYVEGGLTLKLSDAGLRRRKAEADLSQ
jgi:hypothetical protein